MRAQKSAKNIIVALISNALNIVLGVVVQSIFLKTLGEEYLGLNTVLTSILSMLSIAELGLGSAIIYNMYKPIANKDKEKIKSLMKFYKKCYSIIIIVMLAIGLIVSIFLKQIVGETQTIQNLYLLYFLFLIDVIFSYTIAYKRSIIYANQEEYLTNVVHLVYLLVMNGLQILFLYLTHNYCVFLIIKLACRILENVLVNIIANKKYPYINEKDVKELDKKIKDDIIKNIKALFFHKIAGFIVSSTDTILISVFFEGLVTVAYYSNYNLVLSAITTILNQFLLSATASIGDLLTENNKERNYEIYKKLNFLNFVIFIIGATGMACAIEPFITIFFGEQYILSKFILISLILKFFIQGMRRPLMAFKEAAGIFYVDRFVPILESVVNLVASIILLKICGLAGIFLGTAVSSLVILLYSYPKYVYRPLFNKNWKDYYLEFIKTILYATIIIGITMGVNQLIKVNNIFAEQVLSVVIAIIIPVIIITLVSGRTEEYKYYINIIKNILFRKKEVKQ